MYPTLLEVAGISRPENRYDLAGRSLAPVLSGANMPPKRYVVSKNWSQMTVIGERYKLGKWITPPAKYDKWDWGGSHPGMLFDRRNDPLEVDNLIDEPSANAVRE